MTELTFLARTDITAAPVAASILHEGMHARVHAMGVDAESRDRAREERICRRAELDFGLCASAGAWRAGRRARHRQSAARGQRRRADDRLGRSPATPGRGRRRGETALGRRAADGK